jgi:chemotaxis protein MotB
MKKLSIITLGIIVSFSACVPKRKLISSQNRVKVLQSDSLDTHGKLNDCNNTVTSLQQKNRSTQEDLKNLSTTSQAAINNSNMTIAEQQKRLQDLQALIQGQRDVMNKLRKTIADALVNFKPDELTVSIKDGKIYVSLQENLLFKSGSDVVDPKGKTALQSVANVLNNNADINVMIEGHTDSIPVHGKFMDNWALSTARASSIVRILTSDYKVDAHRVTASGRGEFYPIDSNSTPEGRGRNRRTEIILSPNLNELFKLLDK